MNKELEKKIKEILNLINNKKPDGFIDEVESLDDIVRAFKNLMDSDIDRELGADDFLILYGRAQKKYPDFSSRMSDVLKENNAYSVEKNVIELREQTEEIFKGEYDQTKIDQVVNGFSQLAEAAKEKKNFPHNAVLSVMGATIKKYRETEHNEYVTEQVLGAVKDSPLEEPMKKWGPSEYLQDHLDQLDYKPEFNEFANKLTAVKRWNDSKEYKAIITELEYLKDNPIKILRNDGLRSKEYQDLTDNQIKAIPYIRIYSKINQYLLHKAKDGINSNAYNKLGEIEKLSQYIGSKIHELDPGTFKYPDPKNKDNMLSFSSDVVRETYAEEYTATKKFIQKNLDNGSLYKVLKIKREPGSPVTHSVDDFVKDVSKNEAIPHGERERNIKACLDRITLRAQTLGDNLKKNVQYGESHIEPLDPVPSHLVKAKKEFLKSPGSPANDGPARDNGHVM